MRPEGGAYLPSMRFPRLRCVVSGLSLGASLALLLHASPASGRGSDACENCESTLDLVVTSFAEGRAKHFPLYRVRDYTKYNEGGDDSAPGWAEAKADWKRRLVAKRLWEYASTVWPAKRMRHDYGLAMIRPKLGENGEGLQTPTYPGWLVGVVQNGSVRVRYTLDQVNHMCWCDSSWRSFVPDASARP
jgi:hypothetical protein